MYSEIRFAGYKAVGAIVAFDINLSRRGGYGTADFTLTAPIPVLTAGAACEVWLGYDQQHVWKVMTGYHRSAPGERVELGDALWKAQTVGIRQWFVDVMPTEVVAHCLRSAGIDQVQLDPTRYPLMSRFGVAGEPAPMAILAVNAACELSHDLYANRDGVVVWQPPAAAATVYQFEYGVNILDCEYADGQGRLLTILSPFVDHFGQVKVLHPAVPQLVNWVTGVRHYTGDTAAGRTEIFFQAVM